MKIPRDIRGLAFSKLLKSYGYEITRQTGSHIRLTTLLNGEHHITIPSHNPLKIGTLNSIINDIAFHFQISKNQLLDDLFF